MTSATPAQANGHLNDSLSDISDAEVSDCEMDKSKDNDGFIDPNKRTKRRRDSNGSDNTIITTPVAKHSLTVILKPVDSKTLITKLNPVLLAEELDSHAPDGVLQVRTNYRRNLLALDARNLESTQALLALKRLKGIPVQAFEASSNNMTAGVIRGLTMDVTDDDLQSAVRAVVPVHSVRRLGRSEALKIVFAAECLPEHVTVGHTRFKVDPFIEKPLQCHKCCRFGHVEVACLGARRCSRCGGEHDRDACAADQLRCANCNKQHDASSHLCPVYQKEQELFHFRIKNKSDYVTARVAVSSLRKTPSLPSSSELKTTTSGPPPLAKDTSFPPLLNSDAQKRTQTPTSKPKTRPDAPDASSSADCQRAPQASTRTTPREHPPHPKQSTTSSHHSFTTIVSSILALLRSLIESSESPLAKVLTTAIDLIIPLLN